MKCMCGGELSPLTLWFLLKCNACHTIYDILTYTRTRNSKDIKVMNNGQRKG